jgi:CheY-like chemotaxis protein
MKILLAEDERVSRRMLETVLTEWGYEVVLAVDGEAAWQVMKRDSAPSLALIDWNMPGIDGLEVVRRVRMEPGPIRTAYLILLTVRGCREDIVIGLRGGADDYISKPFDLEELHARLHVGQRIIELQGSLALRVQELEEAFSQVKHLQGLLPICMYCKKIRDGEDYWQQVEAYIAARSTAQFSHSICPHCFENIVEPQLETLRLKQAAPLPTLESAGLLEQ